MNQAQILSENRTRWTLPNGLRVVCEPLPHLATVSVGIWIHTGSMMEGPDEEGLAHFMEHMAFKSTLTRSTQRIAEETDLLGGHLNACTTKDYTCYYNKVIAEDLTHTLELMGDLVLNPALPEDEMARERSVICEEIAMEEDDPEGCINELLYQAQFEGTCAWHPILGQKEQILRYTPDSLRKFRAAHYTPDRCVISVCGCYDEGRLRDDIQRIFSAWSGESSSAPVPELQVKDGRKVFVDRDLEQVHLCLGYPGFAFGKKENFTLDMLSAILGTSASARLFQRIREELGLAYTVYSYSTSVEGSGCFALYAAASPENGRRVLDEMQSVFQEMAEKGVTEEEYEQARKMFRVNFLMSHETSGSRMMSMGHSLCVLDQLFTSREILESLESVKRDDILNLARQLVSHKPSLAVLGRHAESWKGSI